MRQMRRKRKCWKRNQFRNNNRISVFFLHPHFFSSFFFCFHCRSFVVVAITISEHELTPSILTDALSCLIFSPSSWLDCGCWWLSSINWKSTVYLSSSVIWLCQTDDDLLHTQSNATRNSCSDNLSFNGICQSAAEQTRLSPENSDSYPRMGSPPNSQMHSVLDYHMRNWKCATWIWISSALICFLRSINVIHSQSYLRFSADIPS